MEIDNYGRLEKIDTNRYRTPEGRNININDSKVTEYKKPFKGYSYYESYTKEQLKTIGELLLYWNQDYKIPLEYNGIDMFDINLNALSGKHGIWTNNCYIEKNIYCHPDPNLIKLLETLSSI